MLVLNDWIYSFCDAKYNHHFIYHAYFVYMYNFDLFTVVI